MGREQTWDTASNREAETGTGSSSGVLLSSADRDWDPLQLARAAYNASVQWHEANLRTQWESNLRSFNNRHGSDSKYHGEEYRHRSKLFRPKTRSAIRRGEAYVAQAYFANHDILDVKPEDARDPANVADALTMKELLQLRLDRKPIPWFLIVQGAFQDTRTLGVCITKQFWEYEEVSRTEYEPLFDAYGNPVFDQDGNPAMQEVEVVDIIKDHPQVRLIPPENLRLDPGADWMNPIESSPYVIELIPMFVTDVKARMANVDNKTGNPQWLRLDDGAIRSAIDKSYNAVRQARENYREDSKDKQYNSVADFDIVWVHENVMRIGGEDWHYYTLGESHLLSEPQPLNKQYLHDERPWVMGYSNIESHKIFPASITELTESLQQEANEIANQRLDNVRFVMNPRQFYRKGSGVDVPALSRSYPGRPIGMKNPTGPQADVMVDRPDDVTASAYAEQDRINVDFDEIAGTFSTSSVQSNRQLNETVGGMKMLQGGSNTLNDYDIRIFTETWTEPVLRQLMRLEQAYETDQALLAVAQEKSGAFKKFGMSPQLDRMLQSEFTLHLNVGIGATDPQQKIERFAFGARMLTEMYGPEFMGQFSNPKEMASEIYGILGFKDSDRFWTFPDDNPETAHLHQIIQSLKEELESNSRGEQTKAFITQQQETNKLNIEQMRGNREILLKLMDVANALDQQAAQQAGEMGRLVHQSGDAERERRFQSQESRLTRAHAGQQAQQERQARADEARQRGNGQA